MPFGTLSIARPLCHMKKDYEKTNCDSILKSDLLIMQ